MGFKAPITRTVLIICLSMVSLSLGSILPFPTNGPTVSTDYDSILIKTWEGIKKRNIDPYGTGLIHRPKSEHPDDAVSEGIGYGMLLALYANDQEYFNKIWQAGEDEMWNGNVYDWRWVDGSVPDSGRGSATDADQDVALALIFADVLVQKGVWQDFQLTTKAGDQISYAQRANEMINTFYETMIQDGLYVKPGNGWGGAGLMNPGYFAPAFYRVFDEFEETDHDWESVIGQCYKSIEASPGYEYGLVRDWMTSDGGALTVGELGYNAIYAGEMLFKDAIRVLWRIATDYLWWGEPRAKRFLENAFNFIETPDRANYYDMEGNLIPDSTYTKLNRFTLERPLREYSPLTLGMWICAAFVGGGAEAAEPFSDSLLTFYEGGDYWGLAEDPNGIEDTLHNEMYFDQFLAWFGASLVSGNFQNLWPILTDPDPQTPTAWVETPTFSIDTGYDANFNPIELTGKLNKPVNWSISVENESGDLVFSTSGQGEDVSMTWLGTGENLSACPAGKYTARINAHGLAEHPAEFWLGRALDISDGNGMLIVDDFSDGDKKPYIGSGWNNFFGETDYFRQQNESEIKKFDVAENDGISALHWRFMVDGFDFDPYVGLDWIVGSELYGSFTELEEIVVTAKAADSALGVSVQLIQEDVSVTFPEDSIYLSTEFETFTLPISDFVSRLGGNTPVDLSKLTAIRFQVQLPEGTENEIVIREMKLGGDFSSFYQAPGEYVKMPENSIAVGRHHQRSTMAIRAMPNNSFLISAPDIIENASVRILSVNGRTIKTLRLREGRAIWDGLSSSGTSVPSGVYVIALQHKNQLIRKNVLISK